MRFVVDASILLRQVADDPDREKAARLLLALGRLGTQTAPALAFYEAGNALRTAFDHEDQQTEERYETVQTLLYGVELAAPDRARAGPIGLLCEKHRLTFYDAAYLDLAVTANAILITNDKLMAEAGKSELGHGRCHGLDDAFRLYAQDLPD